MADLDDDAAVGARHDDGGADEHGEQQILQRRRTLSIQSKFTKKTWRVQDGKDSNS